MPGGGGEAAPFAEKANEAKKRRHKIKVGRRFMDAILLYFFRGDNAIQLQSCYVGANNFVGIIFKVLPNKVGFYRL